MHPTGIHLRKSRGAGGRPGNHSTAPLDLDLDLDLALDEAAGLPRTSGSKLEFVFKNIFYFTRCKPPLAEIRAR